MDRRRRARGCRSAVVPGALMGSITLNLPDDLLAAMREDPALSYARFEHVCVRALREAVKAGPMTLERAVLATTKEAVLKAVTELFALANMGVQAVNEANVQAVLADAAADERDQLLVLVYAMLDRCDDPYDTLHDRFVEQFRGMGFPYPRPESADEDLPAGAQGDPFEARHESACPNCPTPIRRGDMIVWVGRESWAHVQCPPTEDHEYDVPGGEP